MPQFVISLAGIAAILAIAFLLSNGKRRIKLRVVGAAFALQTLMALLVLRTPWGVIAIEGLSNGVIALLDFSKVGIESVFGRRAGLDPLSLGDHAAAGALGGRRDWLDHGDQQGRSAG